MISIFPRTALELVNIKDDAQVAAYHFDAVTEYKLDAKTRYTRYPIEYGVDIQDHAYNEPTKLVRSEEHTSELQSRGHLVCRLLLEKKNSTSQRDRGRATTR